jgi:hypothetical protein
VLWVRDLEPSELGADLPCPLSLVLVDVVGDVLKKVSVVTLEVSHSHLVCDLLNNWELSYNSAGVNRVEDVAKSFSGAILDLSCKDISKIVHEISVVKVGLDSEKLLDICDLISGEVALECLIDVINYSLNLIGALDT